MRSPTTATLVVGALLVTLGAGARAEPAAVGDVGGGPAAVTLADAGGGDLALTEMLPDIDRLWPTDAAGARHTAELRVVAVHGRRQAVRAQ